MKEPRCLDVRLQLADGGEKTVSVRVVSMHADDDLLRQDIYAHDEMHILVTDLRTGLGKLDAVKAEAVIKTIAAMRLRRDQLERSLIEKCLDKNYSGDQREEIYRLCDTENIGFIVLYNALCGISTPLTPSSAVAPSPTTP
jgi:hypothetical protein